jgi:hypothetical protein
VLLVSHSTEGVHGAGGVADDLGLISGPKSTRKYLAVLNLVQWCTAFSVRTWENARSFSPSHPITGNFLTPHPEPHTILKNVSYVKLMSASRPAYSIVDRSCRIRQAGGENKSYM